MTRTLKDRLERILDAYGSARSLPFAADATVVETFHEIERWLQTSLQSRFPTLRVVAGYGKGSWARVPWIALLDTRETTSTQRGVYGGLLFREDMSGMYLALMVGVAQFRSQTSQKEAERKIRNRVKALRVWGHRLEPFGFHPGPIDLHTRAPLPKLYEQATVAAKFYPREGIPDDEVLVDDIENLLRVYVQYIEAETPGRLPRPSQDPADVVQAVFNWITAQGFYFEPWQIAAFVAALKTKPFVILAGVTGTGKSKLPQLIAQATGAHVHLIPVRPDWTDGSELLGYVDLQGTFRPGALLSLAQEAMENAERFHIAILDEMNLARVEHYFAEVLSLIETRIPAAWGGYRTPPLLNTLAGPVEERWRQVVMPPNMAIVGTVNMDESAHTFSRKVLDRAFTLEISDADLGRWEPATAEAPSVFPVSPSFWYPRALRLGERTDWRDEERRAIERTIETLTALNRALAAVQLQVGYRTRDEMALFLIHAVPLHSLFVRGSGEPVDPLDVAVHMKILPRIIGGSPALRGTLTRMLAWATGEPFETDEDVDGILKRWEEADCGLFLPDARFPYTAARLCLMITRLRDEGFTSYWL